ncbi:MAG: TonB-dependent receptor, partial [Flavobacteriales bacterium]|nr:TonB-dependent receptor [Flavobacteriales bacterium]
PNTQRYSVSAGTGLIGDKFSLDMRLSSITSDGYIDRASADLKSYFLQGAWVGKTRSLRFITFRGKEVTYQAWDGAGRRDRHQQNVQRLRLRQPGGPL